MKLSFKISLTIGVISVVISTIVAGISYYFQLEQATKQSEQLVKQIAQSANRTGAIAAYLDDNELATEIVIGLANNDLIAGATIETVSYSPAIVAGKSDYNVASINIPLYSPFIETEPVGLLTVFPDAEFIRKQASDNSLKTAYLLLGLSVCIAIIVGLFIRAKLTHPLRNVAYEFSQIETSAPGKMQAIDIRYYKNDEIGKLVYKVNLLINALKQQFLSEKQLRRTTEELQKRFRLLFEQATAGIGLLDVNGTVKIANPAFNELFDDNTEGKSIISYLASPSEFEEQIKQLFAESSNPNAQVEMDVICYRGAKKCYFHCLLSTINEARDKVREASNDLSKHMVEIIIYDVTERKELELKTRYEADHDPLTGLQNRRAGTLGLSEQLSEINDCQPIFAMLMIDLDKFKPINDIHGHEVGDIVLSQVSERMLKAITSVDSTCIRWGGDEFVIGLSVCLRSEVETYTQLILTAINQKIIINNDLEVSVGASIGVIMVDALTAKSTNIDEIIARADALMYETKQNKDALENNYLIIDF